MSCIAVEKGTGSEVLGWSGGHRDVRRDFQLLPPREFTDIREALFPQPTGVAFRTDHPDAGAKVSEGRKIEMVVMAMGEQDGMDFRQIPDGTGRRDLPPEGGQGQWSAVVRENRIDQQRDATALQEE